MRRHTIDRDKLARELAGLPGLPTEILKRHWRSLYDSDPPVRISRPLLLRSIAHRMQERALGSLKPALCRLLDQVALEQTPSSPTPIYKPGTRLLRQWHGETHEVILLEDGVQYRGEKIRSLSEVACRITGTKWSGPRFFGLKNREAGHGA